MTLPDDIPIIPEPTKEHLNVRQTQLYREHRTEFLTWLYTLGKNPSNVQGYSTATTRNTAYRTDKFARWAWSNANTGFTVALTHTHADDYMRALAGDESSNSHKSKCRKAIKRLFKWRAHEKGGEEWESNLSFSENTSHHPRDYLTETERTSIREAALEYGSIPAYNSVTPGERSRWKAYLAQRFSKPKETVGLDDWERANGWKIPSLVWTSLDAALRPIEVKRAKITWVDIDNCVLRIPKEESSKNNDNWIVSLTDETARALDRWLTQREQYPHYHDSDCIWLTRQGNPYQSRTLSYVLKRLCEIAGINTENREMSWYAIRHSTGTYLSREDGLAATRDQLRHRSKKTTMRYDQTPVEDRRDALENLK